MLHNTVCRVLSELFHWQQPAALEAQRIVIVKGSSVWAKKKTFLFSGFVAVI